MCKAKQELAQVIHLNWDEGLLLDLVAIKSCEVSCAHRVPARRKASWGCTRFLLLWVQPSRLNLTYGPHMNIM